MSFFASLQISFIPRMIFSLPGKTVRMPLRRYPRIPVQSYSTYSWQRDYQRLCSLHMNFVFKSKQTGTVSAKRTVWMQSVNSMCRTNLNNVSCQYLSGSTTPSSDSRGRTEQSAVGDENLTALAQQILEATRRSDIRAASVQPYIVVNLLKDLFEAGCPQLPTMDLLSGRLWLLQNHEAVVSVVETLMQQGFTPQVALDFLASLPAEYCMQERPLADIAQIVNASIHQLRDLGFSDRNLTQLVEKSPHVLLASTKIHRSMFTKLKSLFTKSDAMKVAVTCPEVFSQSWTKTNKIFDYAFFTMCYTQPQIVQSGVLACPLHKLQDRHAFLSRAGFFVEVKKKNDPRLNPNPPLRFIVKASDADFASEFGGLSEEEYSSFLAMRELERDEEENEVDGTDRDSDTDSDLDSFDSDSDSREGR